MRLASACLGLLLVASPLSAQRRPPAFLQGEATDRLATPHLEAQAQGPVKVGSDGRATVTVLVTPRPKMHVYGPDVVGYVPFRLVVEPAAGMAPGKVTYPPSQLYVFPPTGESSRAYMKPFTVRQALQLAPDLRKVLAAGKPVEATVTLRYQACDDTVCYRPTTGAFTIELSQ